MLWKDRERRRRGLLRADVHVKLRVRVEAFRTVITLKRRQTVHRVSLIAVLDRFGEGYAVLHNRARKGHTRCKGSKAHDRPVDSSHPWQEVLRRHSELVEVARSRFHI